MSINVNDLTFGIEIECCIPTITLNRNGWVRGAYHRGIEIPGFPGWTLQSDRSVQRGASRNSTPCEVVSPILRGAEGLAQVAAMCVKLNEMRAKVNSSTGLHVHVGFDRANVEALKRLIHLVAHNETALFASTGTKTRRLSTYCQPISAMQALRTRVAEMQQIEALEATADRYRVLNLTNIIIYNGRPTVEFRAFAGTTSYLKIAGYVQLCLGLVQKALTAKQTLSWEFAQPKAKNLARKGEGLTALNVLLGKLGWTRAYGRVPQVGVLNASELKAVITELRRLATKYDGRDPETLRAQREAARAAAQAQQPEPALA